MSVFLPTGHALVNSPEYGGVRTAPTYGRDRVCAHDGCETRLNQYNASELCAVHDDGKLPITRTRSRDRPPIAKVCGFESCGRTFYATEPRKGYCSDACRANAANHRWRERRKTQISSNREGVTK